MNFRLIFFLCVVALPFLWLFGTTVKHAMTGGISQHDGYAEVDLKALGNFPFDQHNGTQNEIPPRWRGLDGQRVVLEGFMVPTTSAGPYVRDFQFVYNVQKCCFGGPPQVQERVFGHAPGAEGVFLQPTDQFTRLTGILHVHVKRDSAGVITSVFDLDVEKEEPITG